jgi:hypothetical protein
VQKEMKEVRTKKREEGEYMARITHHVKQRLVSFEKQGG